jgi:aspartate carbamoyltransferase catalytic subunit
MNSERLSRLADSSIVLHPGPMNRGLEIDAASADSSKSRILDQVQNGVAVRMAVLFHLLAGDKGEKR